MALTVAPACQHLDRVPVKVRQTLHGKLEEPHTVQIDRCLAPIVDATFKLLPIPQTSQTLLVSYSDGQPLSADVATLAGSQLEPVALDLHVALDGEVAIMETPLHYRTRAKALRVLVPTIVR